MPDQRDYRSEIMASSGDRRREFKSSAPWVQLKYKIARAALAMANTRDGGIVIVGVDNDGTPSGITNEHMLTYDYDQIKSFINQHADPYVACSIHRPMLDQLRFLVIDIAQFEELPVICKKNCHDDRNQLHLQKGGVYVRPFAMPESRLVQSQTEMREIIETAVDRSVRRFLVRAEGAGASLRVQPTDSERFEQERGEFEQLIARSPNFATGHFLVSIRPSIYDSLAIQPISRILELADQLKVRHFGWTFPFITRREEAVEQRCAGMPGHPEGWEDFWRMYQSGQFLCAVSYSEDRDGRQPLDYLEERDRRMAPHGFEPKGVINIHRLIILATQAYEFAARLARTLSWSATVEVRITLTHTTDRIMVSTVSSRPVGRFWRTTAEQIESRREIPVESLLAQAPKLAADAITEILERFAGSEIRAMDVSVAQMQLLGKATG